MNDKENLTETLTEYVKHMQWSFGGTLYEEDDRTPAEGLKIKAALLQSLVDIQSNPATSTVIQLEAKEVRQALEIALADVLILSFEDEAETKPKSIHFEITGAYSVDVVYENGGLVPLENAIRESQTEIFTQAKEAVEAGTQTELQQAQYNYLAPRINSDTVDWDQRQSYLEAIVRDNITARPFWLAMQLVLLERKRLADADTAPMKSRLYSNSKTIDSTNFGINMFLSDNYVRGIRGANPAAAQQQFDRNNPDLHPRVKSNAAFRVRNKSKAQSETEFVFDQAKFAIRTAEEFANRLMDFRDAKVLQTFCALMKLANIQDSPVYRKVPLSELMQIVLKPSGSNKFNKEQRADFTRVLHRLSDVSISVYAIGQEVDKKTGKKSKAIMKEERGVKVFRMVAEYSVKKQYQGLAKEELRAEHFDQAVIERFSGEILPGNAHMFQQPARIYPDSLLHMNANTDAKAILLGFVIQTRFSQSPETPLEWDRPYLIDLCDYHKTNSTKPSQATKQLVNNLDKLKKLGIIARYSGLTDGNQGKIKIYPPANTKPALAS